jgi:MoaA/NifB/PqqE/SkfB family radical SAM enzyme
VKGGFDMLPATEAPAAGLPVIEENLVTTLPIVVLNAHSRCNCRCVMCDIWKRDATSEVTAADLERHRESFRSLGVRWVVLSGGEPLMHTGLRDLCSFFRELGIRLTLLTTGLLLQRRSLEVAEFVDDVIVSLDGPAEVHDAIRRTPGGFAIIKNGIVSLRERRPHMIIKARTTVQKANHLWLSETVGAALDLELSGISFLAADLTSEAFNRPLLWPVERQDSIALSESEVCSLSDEIGRLIVTRSQQVRSSYISESPAKLRKIVSHFRAHLGLEVPRAPECNAPWVSAVIEADGLVRPCFFHRPLGNIRDGSLDEVVNGESALSFRQSLNIARNPICQRCVCSLNYVNGNPSSGVA